MMKEKKDLAKMAKLKLLEELSQKMAQLMMAEKGEDAIPGEMQKVSVMAPDEAGLQEGLAKAEELVSSEEPSLESMLSTDEDDIDLAELELEEDEDELI